MKTCFKCDNEKPLSEFYKHKYMSDGHLNKCKSCTKKDSITHRGENLERIRAYDRARGNRQAADYNKKWREKFPKKYKAITMVNNAVKGKKLKKFDCEVCGADKTVGHHDDYDYPLSVRWLCQAHHKQWHAKHGEGMNAI